MLGNHIFPQADHIKDFSEIFRRIDDLRPDWIVLDRQKNSSQLVKRLKRTGSNVLLIEDDSWAGKYANLVWDANIQSKKTGYMIGYENVLLDPDLFRFKKKTNLEKINDIFISLGGTDVNANIPEVIKNLDNKGFELHIFPGVRYTEYLNYNKSSVKIYDDKENLFDIASNCDLALVAGGMTMYEMLALGVPTVVWPQVSHQERNAGKLAERELVKKVNSIKDLLKIINELTDNKEKYTCLFKRIDRLDLSDGLKKFKNLLEG